MYVHLCANEPASLSLVQGSTIWLHCKENSHCSPFRTKKKDKPNSLDIDRYFGYQCIVRDCFR